MKNKKQILVGGILAVAIAAFAAGYCLLPETLAMQITMNGQPGTTAPKLLGLLLPLGVSGIFAISYYKSENKRHLAASLLGLLLYVFTFAVNL